MNYDDHELPWPGYMRAYPCGPADFGWDLAECREIRELAGLEEMVWGLGFSTRSWQGGPWVCDEELRRQR
jgi:hypothetical protein